MKYILIIILIGVHRSAALTVEFNDLPSCRAAAAEIQKQTEQAATVPGAILCAAKGAK